DVAPHDLERALESGATPRDPRVVARERRDQALVGLAPLAERLVRERELRARPRSAAPLERLDEQRVGGRLAARGAQRARALDERLRRVLLSVRDARE